jgi:8-oxo-dGTP pyrophosphatase MutT (NUDIX family)
MTDQQLIRKASTIVLARNSASGPKVFMLERHIKSEFASGAYVFPGGAVDVDDGLEFYQQISTGVDDASANHQTSVKTGGLGFWVAVIRECFEECGVLIARSVANFDPNSDPRLVSFEDHKVAQRYSNYRDKLNRGDLSFEQMCRAENITLAAGQVMLFSRWVIPLGMPKRFDTCFFLCQMPANQTPLHDGHETVAGLWVTPSAALEMGKSAKIKLVPATIKTLERLSGYPAGDDLITGNTPSGIVAPICPTIVRDANGVPVKVQIPLPGGEVEIALGDELKSMIGAQA